MQLSCHWSWPQARPCRPLKGKQQITQPSMALRPYAMLAMACSSRPFDPTCYEDRRPFPRRPGTPGASPWPGALARRPPPAQAPEASRQVPSPHVPGTACRPWLGHDSPAPTVDHSYPRSRGLRATSRANAPSPGLTTLSNALFLYVSMSMFEHFEVFRLKNQLTLSLRACVPAPLQQPPHLVDGEVFAAFSRLQRRHEPARFLRTRALVPTDTSRT